MDHPVINQYGDTKITAGSGHGVDVASQRADDLDLHCLSFIENRLLAQPVAAADIGCGQCGQALRMARLGASVYCLDLVDQFSLAKDLALKEGLPMQFFAVDILSAKKLVPAPLDVVICQRTIHYLPYSQAEVAVAVLVSMLASGGQLFISASGIHSELGQKYSASAAALDVRYGRLAPEMAAKHNIHEPVCLYSEADLRVLLEKAGLTVTQLFSSPFGNIKAVAVKA